MVLNKNILHLYFQGLELGKFNATKKLKEV